MIELQVKGVKHRLLFITKNKTYLKNTFLSFGQRKSTLEDLLFLGKY